MHHKQEKKADRQKELFPSRARHESAAHFGSAAATAPRRNLTFVTVPCLMPCQAPPATKRSTSFGALLTCRLHEIKLAPRFGRTWPRALSPSAPLARSPATTQRPMEPSSSGGGEPSSASHHALPKLELTASPRVAGHLDALVAAFAAGGQRGGSAIVVVPDPETVAPRSQSEESREKAAKGGGGWRPLAAARRCAAAARQLLKRPVRGGVAELLPPRRSLQRAQQKAVRCSTRRGR